MKISIGIHFFLNCTPTLFLIEHHIEHRAFQHKTQKNFLIIIQITQMEIDAINVLIPTIIQSINSECNIQRQRIRDSSQ